MLDLGMNNKVRSKPRSTRYLLLVISFVGLAVMSINYNVRTFNIYNLELSSQRNHPYKIGNLRAAEPPQQLLIKPPINHDDDPIYDIVTLVHHGDMKVFIEYSYKSWVENLKSCNKIYIIADPLALPILEEKIKNDKLWQAHAIIINQELYPFTFHDIDIDPNGRKPTWFYQQLLKLYSYQVIKGLGYPISNSFLVIDSDTALVRPVNFFAWRNDKYLPLYSIASAKSGSFPTDDNVGQSLINEVFNLNDYKIGEKKFMKKAFPTSSTGTTFTSITHHMVFNSEVLEEMREFIEGLHGNEVSWRILSSLKRSILSEWELYSSYIMNFHRKELGVRQLPYVNWGTVNDKVLTMLKEEKDIVYLTRHDDWSDDNICCVNSHNWDVKECKCCPSRECERLVIDCSVLEIEGCSNNSFGGYNVMVFE